MGKRKRGQLNDSTYEHHPLIPPTELNELVLEGMGNDQICLLYTSPSPRDRQKSRMPSSA